MERVQQARRTWTMSWQKQKTASTSEYMEQEKVNEILRSLPSQSAKTRDPPMQPDEDQAQAGHLPFPSESSFVLCVAVRLFVMCKTGIDVTLAASNASSPGPGRQQEESVDQKRWSQG